MAFYKTLYDLTLRLPLNNFARWKPEPKIWNNWLNVEEWLSTINRESLCYSPAHGWGFIFLLTLLGWCRNSSHLLDPNEQQFLQDSLIKGKSCKKKKNKWETLWGLLFHVSYLSRHQYRPAPELLSANKLAHEAVSKFSFTDVAETFTDIFSSSSTNSTYQNYSISQVLK